MIFSVISFRNQTKIKIKTFFLKENAISYMWNIWLGEENYDFIEVKNIFTGRVVQRVKPNSGVFQE